MGAGNLGRGLAARAPWEAGDVGVQVHLEGDLVWQEAAVVDYVAEDAVLEALDVHLEVARRARGVDALEERRPGEVGAAVGVGFGVGVGDAEAVEGRAGGDAGGRLRLALEGAVKGVDHAVTEVPEDVLLEVPLVVAAERYDQAVGLVSQKALQAASPFFIITHSIFLEHFALGRNWSKHIKPSVTFSFWIIQTVLDNEWYRLGPVSPNRKPNLEF